MRKPDLHLWLSQQALCRRRGASSCMHGLTSSCCCRRKNLGYLWAIQHGAEELYETDDDNEPVNNMLPNLNNGYYVYNGTGRKVANPYAHFGFPHIWPRGYPLDQIRPQAQAERFSRLQARPLILQGLADKDPDVDAIFRCAQSLAMASRASTQPCGGALSVYASATPAAAYLAAHTFTAHACTKRSLSWRPYIDPAMMH